VTAIADLLTPEARARLLERLDDPVERELDRLAGLARLMREPGYLPPAPEPVPLHRTGRDTTTERTTP
jgi:hypothetical protein